MLNTIFSLLLFTFAYSSLFGIIFESEEMSDVLPYLSESTLVLFDLDDTLITSAQQLGSSDWEEYIRRKSLSAGYDEEQVQKISEAFIFFIEPFTLQMKLVDPPSFEIIKQIQKRCLTLVLTAREPCYHLMTYRQLEAVDLCFKNTLFENIFLDTPYESCYQNGILFSNSENSKGETLKSFFKTLNYWPKRIVFVDDKWARVREVEIAAQEMGIEFIGIQYLKVAKTIKPFNPKIAEIQWSALPKILTDDEAEKLLNY